jgi:roadblock/LC7 domain-containing protein
MASVEITQKMAEMTQKFTAMTQEFAEMTQEFAKMTQVQNGHYLKIRLPNGKFVGFHKSVERQSLADVEEAKAQVFKMIRIAEGPHEGHVEFEAVGGHHDGKVLDNRTRKNKNLGFYERNHTPAQRWMVNGGKIQSAVEGNLYLTIKEDGKALFKYSGQGTIFNFVRTEAPV